MKDSIDFRFVVVIGVVRVVLVVVNVVVNVVVIVVVLIVFIIVLIFIIVLVLKIFNIIYCDENYHCSQEKYVAKMKNQVDLQPRLFVITMVICSTLSSLLP